MELHMTATGCYLSYEITQFYHSFIHSFIHVFDKSYCWYETLRF